MPPSPAGSFNNTDVRTLKRGNIRADNGEEGGDHYVGNCLDIGRVDVVVDGVDMPARDALRLKEVSDPYDPLSRCSFKTACIVSKI